MSPSVAPPPRHRADVATEEEEEAPPSGSRAALRSVGVNAIARMIALPVSALLGIVVTRLIIDNYGEASYAEYALVVGIGALLPFADLGLGAAIMNSTAEADDPHTDAGLHRTLVSCLRLLSVSGVVVILVALVITVSGDWDNILGAALQPGAGAMAAGLCLTVLGFTLIVSVGQRLLAGLGKYVWVVGLNGLQTPIVLLVLLVMVKLDVGTGVYMAVVAYTATFLLGLVALLLANRLVRPTLRRSLHDAWRIRTVRGAKVFDTAWPMLIIMISGALAMQTDRIVLSHRSTVSELAEYSLAAQMFNPLLGVVATATLALWPIFARARAKGVRSDVSPMGVAALFGVAAVVLTLIISLLSGVLSRLASGGEITIGPLVLVGFSLLVVVQAVKYPLGTYMTDAHGLRYQALMILVMLPLNFGLSWILAAPLGAAGPIIGSLVGVAVFEMVANLVYVHRRQLATVPADAA